ncbi:hypothetical protein B7P43_G02606 [Cryptotermes secundus]|nr:hypothetical protein B7P43_G02606 [Cryptotermes secundus]
MICRPFQKYNLNRSGALILVCAIWLYALSLTVPPLIGWGAFVLEGANISCSVNWESHTYNAMTYIMFLFTMGLVVPIGIILFSYLNIIRTMRQSTLEAGRVTKAETRVTLMIVVMILAFLVAWSPYAVLALVVAFGDSGIVSPGLAVVPAIIAKSSFCYNPLIYVGLNTQFQLAWKRLLGVHVTVDTSHGVDGEHTSGTNTESALEGTPSARFRGSKFLSFIFKVPDHDSIQSLSTCAATTVTIGTLHEVKECSGPALVENQEKGEASAMREGQEGPVAVEQREIRDDMQSNSFQESKVE